MNGAASLETKSDSGAPSSALDSVLIAEDDPMFRHILQSWLQTWNYRVTPAENGLDAWNLLQQESSPKMAILDWMMPGLDGIEVCRRIRSRHDGPYRYVLLLTAKDNKKDVVAGLEAGADDYLVKPFDRNELRARVRAGRRILELQDALIRVQEALRIEAAHDRLTGLWNRGAVLDLLEREMRRSVRTGSPMGVLMVDLDFFKKINDSHGHVAGDAVLREVATRLSGAVRSYDAVGRYGGEEFLVVLTDCGLADIPFAGERVRRSVAEGLVDAGSVQLPVTVSVGAACTQGASTPMKPEQLVRAADSALYSAKAKGRNCVECTPVPVIASEVSR